MPFNAVLSYTGGALCALLATFAILRYRRPTTHIFSVGMVALAAEEALNALSFAAPDQAASAYWLRWRFVAGAVVPGTWLLFSVTYARAYQRHFLDQWKWIAAVLYGLPLGLAIFARDALFYQGSEATAEGFRGIVYLDWAGQVFYVARLCGAVAILMNFERTLRSSIGLKRWQVKFMLLGIGSMFGVRIYTSSQAILYAVLSDDMAAVGAVAVIVAALLVAASLARSQWEQVDIYISRTFLYNSLTILFVATYLLFVGVLAHLLQIFRHRLILPLDTLVVYVALVLLAIILLSTQTRRHFKEWVNRHFKRPAYDYRSVWMRFTHDTATLLDKMELCRAVSRLLTETFDAPSVSIWLLNEPRDRLALAASTFLSPDVANRLEGNEEFQREILRRFGDRHAFLDLNGSSPDWGVELALTFATEMQQARLRCALPLFAGDSFLGLVTLSRYPRREPFTGEEVDLLKAITDQTASILLNAKLSENLQRSKEHQALQNASAFFMHDLKNLASNLSLTLRNLPLHFEDKEFRADAQRVIANGIEKLNAMCSGLALLREGIELKTAPGDLNALVRSTVEELCTTSGTCVSPVLRPLPTVIMDARQLQKVLMNLILNARDAAPENGKIEVETGCRGNGVFMAVTDNGCGMSEAFIRDRLFRPFQTTKKKGMGIGLYHSKLIIEAHRGQIEVETKEGGGSTFRVFLPASAAAAAQQT